MLLPACLWQCCREHLIKQNYDLVAGPSNMRPRRAQFRGEKLPAYNAPSDDWGLVCARSRLDPLFGLCVCEVRTPRPMGARHTWGRDVRVASPVNRDHTREHKRKSEFCFEVGNETRNPPRSGRNPIKRWRVAYAQVAKKPNRKSGCVNRPANALGIRHPTPFPTLGGGHQRRLADMQCQPNALTSFFGQPTGLVRKSGTAICALMSTRPNTTLAD